MPGIDGHDRDWKKAKYLRNEYKKRLIAKGVIDGSSKMLKLMSRKRF